MSSLDFLQTENFSDEITR